MRIVPLLAVPLFAAAIARAEPLLPTADGTTWQYESTEELGGPAAAAPATASVTVRVGRQTLAGREFIKLETTTDDVVTKTELMTLDDHGWVCHFRAGKDGRMAKLDPPQTLVPATIKSGDSWDTDGEVAGNIGSWLSDGKREIGYWIDRALWGRGIATEALSAFLSA